MVRIALSLMTCLLIHSPARAQTPSENQAESWYAYWALGFAKTTYDGQISKYVDELASDPYNRRLTIALDYFGFYWPVKTNAILGFVISAVGDQFSNNVTKNIFAYYQYTFSGSLMYFFSDSVGNGFFVRGDLGSSMFYMNDRDKLFQNGSKYSDSGSGHLIGVGYGIPLTGGDSRLLLGVNLAGRDANSIRTQSISATVGILF